MLCFLNGFITIIPIILYRIPINSEKKGTHNLKKNGCLGPEALLRGGNDVGHPFKPSHGVGGAL